MRIYVAILTIGISLGFTGLFVAQGQAPDLRSPLELCQVELSSVRSQLVTIDERSTALQTLMNRQAIEREQQELKQAIEVAHPGCRLDWLQGGVLICESDAVDKDDAP